MNKTRRVAVATNFLLGAIVLLVGVLLLVSMCRAFADVRSPSVSRHGSRAAGGNHVSLRVASASLVSDTILLQLLGAGHLAAVSWVVDWPEYSPHAGTVPRHIPRLTGDPESLIALEPSLAVIADHSAFGLGSALRAAGIHTLELTAPLSLTAVINDVERVGSRVDRVAAAKDWSAALHARVAAVETRALHRRKWQALIVDSGFAQALGTLADDLLRRLNTTNPARESGLQGGVALDAERLFSWRPDVVFVAVASATPVSDASAELLNVAGYDLLRHLSDWAPRRVVGLPRQELGAVSPLAVDALEAMDRALEALQ